jgi:hypothetical protein
MPSLQWIPKVMQIESNEAEIRSLIKSEAIQIEGRLVDASNATLLGRIDDELVVIYKPIAGERPLWDFPNGNLASREIAAFILSEKAGFGLVPFTVMRDGPYGMGAVQQWITIDEELDVIEFATQDDPQLRAMSLFDAIINNTDRKYGHILMSESGKLYGCDHGVTFHEENKLRTVLWQWAGSALTTSEIAQLNFIRDQISTWRLETLITTTEISAVISRIDRLLQENAFPMPNPDWPAIPWPPY